MSEQYNQQRRTNTSNKLYGRHRAKVVNVEHPEGLYMVTVRVLDLWDSIPDEDLPFAEFLLPLGAKPLNGHAIPVEPEDLVWVEFPNGDTRYPLITGSVYHAPEYKSNLPDDVNGTPYEHKRAAGEPPAAAYDRKDDLYQRHGIRELKTHTGGWQITHVATGTGIEITPQGKIVIHCEGDQFQSSTGKKLEQHKELEIKVSGNALIDAQGNATVNAGGDASINAQGMATIKAGADLNIEAGGNLNLKAQAVTGSAMDYDFK